MNFHFKQPAKSPARKSQAAFTLMEVVISLLILRMVMAGTIYGYVQANRSAEWSSMSLAAQSYASQGAEQARSANWAPRTQVDDLSPGTRSSRDFMDIPTKGVPTDADFSFWVTNAVTITDVSVNPPLRQIRSVAVWTFPMTGNLCTNTVVLLRAPDQ